MKFKTREEFEKAIRKHFKLDESASVDEAVRVDQSYETLTDNLRDALNEWSGRPATDGGMNLYVAYTFPDRLIAYCYAMDGDQEAWEIPWSQATGTDAKGEPKFTFGVPVSVERIVSFEPTGETVDTAVSESTEKEKGKALEESNPKLPDAPRPSSTDTPAKTKKGKFTELSETLLEEVDRRADDPPGGKRVKAIGGTANRINQNGRLYPRVILADALRRLNGKLDESAGQGRFILTGEAEHPKDKGKRADILETVFRWDAASLNESDQIVLEGVIIPTSKGKDLQVLSDFKVPIRLSQRGYGESEVVTENGVTFDRVTYLDIKGYDAVAQPSDLTAGLLESLQHEDEGERDADMTLEQLLQLLKDKPEMLEAVISKMDLAKKKELAESIGTTSEMLTQRMKEALAAKQELEGRKLQEAIDEAIKTSTKDLPYGELNESFIQSIRDAKPAKPEDVSPLVESKLHEWDIIVSKMRLAQMGRGRGVAVIGPVFERETHQPEFTRAAWELTESMAANGTGKKYELFKAERGDIPGTGSLVYTRMILKRFDENYKRQLAEESKSFDEAEQTTDLNLPYTVMRTIIEQAFPELIAANVFDFGVASSSPDRLYFETYAGETGVVVAVTSETVASIWDTWVEMAQNRLVPGTITITNSGASTTYAEGTDYVIDYGDGKIYALSTGTITSGQSLKANYTYDAYRKGEMAEIERAKNVLAFKTLEIMADRLATQISNEAIVFSRSQMNYDAVGRTLSNIMRLLRRKIDQDILYEAISACLIQANNSGGTWASGSDTLDMLAAKMGVTKTKVYSRFYVPTAYVMSSTNADRLSNWSGYTRLGFDNALLSAAGFAGSIKGLPIFASPEFSDGYILAVNRELVMHRVFQAMQIKGPYPSFSNGKLVAADQYYIEEYNGTDAPVPQKGAYMKVT